ncbi:helix-turn-helix domain-containing protein [Paenibacillus sp. SC116]|uniref:helix-turn-helix domain-containing protein n=1 Tax=Paenibacillus sp. SC116 TaxID=2968986 RepID=UPI00215A6206|nr:helix-turn-helix domain-containing protein [Paenibacillus sp. SC116]MCR8846405.1 helix-turn-helix domain-containing protein [Paenibacillus sp. SC116]
MNQLNINEMEYVCNMIYTTFNLPVYALNLNGEILFEYSATYIHNPMYSSKMDMLKPQFLTNNPHEFPVFKTTIFMENFFTITWKDEGICKGIIIVGPVLYSTLNEESLTGMLNDLHLYKEERMREYYAALPVINQLKFTNISRLMHYMIYNGTLDTVEILQQNELLHSEAIEMEQPQVHISENRQHHKFHASPIMEKKVYQCIERGRKEELIVAINSLSETGIFGNLSRTSYVRSSKNLGIGAITMATRAAVQGGLHPEIAYTLSDLYIQNLEEIKDSRTINQFMISALYDFADRVEKNREQKYSRPINACKYYIFTHLYDEIKLADLAEVSAMNPSYLSTLFKKEVGISLSEYILRAKIEEAMSLIDYTQHSLSDIYTLLNFHDQSHFTKTFKKFVGLTPREYKNRVGTSNLIL